jgi:ABC-2 type transport system permease protein
MQAYLTLTRRELASYFVSWTGYAIIAVAAFLMGLSFVVLLVQLRFESISVPVTELFYSTPFFWLILLLAAPVITMRLFAHEKSSGTFETLMTTAVSDGQVVMAKFTAALLFYLVLWLPLLACIFIVRHYTNDPAALDLGAIGSTYLGIFLMGGVYMSLGCFGSAITRSQIVAAMVSLVGGISLFLLSFLADRFQVNAGWQAQAIASVAMFDHMHDFARGVVDTRPVVFYLSLTGFFLFLTLRTLESRRWK